MVETSDEIAFRLNLLGCLFLLLLIHHTLNTSNLLTQPSPSTAVVPTADGSVRVARAWMAASDGSMAVVCTIFFLLTSANVDGFNFKLSHYP